MCVLYPIEPATEAAEWQDKADAPAGGSRCIDL